MDVTTQQPQQMSVPLSRLIRDEANVRRKYDNDSIANMKASILAQGVIQPLAVRPPLAEDADLGGQLYRVFAGGRRLRALMELAAEKTIDADFAVPVIVREVDDRQASEMSLTENIIRRQMEPADEFRAFKELADQGMSLAEIALRFGQSERFVKGRLALGNVHPEILAAYEEGGIKLESLMAYTVCPEPATQVIWFRENRKSWQIDHPHYIKHALRGGDGLKPTSKLALFIGEEAYLAAGGQVSDDLFGNDTVWTSDEIIQELKASRFEEFKAESLAEGWSFVDTVQERGIYALYDGRYEQPAGTELSEEDTARMDELAALLENEDGLDEDEFAELEAEYEAFQQKGSVFTAEQRAKLGILFDLDRFEWRFGALPMGAEKAGAANASSSAASPAKEKDPLALTQPLRDLIGDTATAAFKTAAIADPHKTLALIAAMLEQHENRSGSRPSRLKVERIDINYGAKPENKERSIKAAAAAYARMTPEDLVAAVAGLFAATVDLTEKWLMKDFDYSHGENRDEARLEHLALFDARPVDAFDAEAYFAACTKPMIDAAMREMTGHAAVKPKKADMAREAAEAATASGWLPGPLRLKGYKIRKVA